MLVKSTTGFNFTNILSVAFLYESFENSFFVISFLVCTLQKNISAKAALKMLMKLTPGTSQRL